MPRQSKIRSPSAKPGAKESRPEINGNYVCTRCGLNYRVQRHNFSSSQSPLFAKNNGYLPVCGSCVDAMYNRYKDLLGSEDAAAKRICMKFDIYWSEKLFNSARKTIASENYASIMRSYIAKTNLARFLGKTFDDTLIEETAAWAAEETARQKQLDDEMHELAKGDGATRLDDVEFWGDGYSSREYEMLNKKYAKWVSDHMGANVDIEDLPVGTATLFKQICTLELQINRNMIAGKPTESAINQLNNLIGSVNARPDQNKDDGSDDSFDSLPFGVGIRVFENNKPIPKPLPQLEDVDGIVRYITIWFLGHLCKMLNIKNTYCRMYEEEIERLKVERPDLEGEDDETVFDNIFGDIEQ